MNPEALQKALEYGTEMEENFGRERARAKKAEAALEELRTAPSQPEQGEAARLREALGFYADPDTYFAIGFSADPPCGGFIEDLEEIDGVQRPGRRARVALSAPSDSQGGQERCGGHPGKPNCLNLGTSKDCAAGHRWCPECPDCNPASTQGEGGGEDRMEMREQETEAGRSRWRPVWLSRNIRTCAAHTVHLAASDATYEASQPNREVCRYIPDTVLEELAAEFERRANVLGEDSPRTPSSASETNEEAASACREKAAAPKGGSDAR